VAKKQAEEAEHKRSKQETEKSFVLKVTKQQTITNCLNFEDQPEEEGDDAEDEDEDEDDDNEMEDRDNNGCNAHSCKINDIVRNSKDVVEWVQCRLCPKWYHQYCVEDAWWFQCPTHK